MLDDEVRWGEDPVEWLLSEEMFVVAFIGCFPRRWQCRARIVLLAVEGIGGAVTVDRVRRRRCAAAFSSSGLRVAVAFTVVFHRCLTHRRRMFFRSTRLPLCGTWVVALTDSLSATFMPLGCFLISPYCLASYFAPFCLFRTICECCVLLLIFEFWGETIKF